MSSVKFVHIADPHLGSSFSNIPYDKRAIRQNECIYTFLKAVSAAKNSDILLLPGDVFDSGNVSIHIIDAFLDALRDIPETQVFYSCGNHDDYYTDAVQYCLKSDVSNLHIFPPDKITSFTMEDIKCRIYGGSFSSENCYKSIIDSPILSDDEYINILCIHGDISSDKYNYIDINLIDESHIRYAALGHIHSYSNVNIFRNTYYAYSGVIEGRGFDECGSKGYIIGEISPNDFKYEFVPCACRMYIDEKIDISEFKNKYELLDVLNSLSECDKNICRFTFIGDNNMAESIDCHVLESQITAYYAICIDQSKPASSPYDYLSQSNLKGKCAMTSCEMIESLSDKSEIDKVNKAFNLLINVLDN